MIESPSGMCSITRVGRVRRLLPELVVAPAPDRRVAVDRRRQALGRADADHERAVGRERVESERVDVGPRRVRQARVAERRQVRLAVLGRLDRRAGAQEVAVAVDLVLVEERRAVPREQLADRLELRRAARAARASRCGTAASSTTARRRRSRRARSDPERRSARTRSQAEQQRAARRARRAAPPARRSRAPCRSATARCRSSEERRDRTSATPT